MSYLVGRILESWRDRVTQSPKFIDTDHAYIHEGGAFQTVFEGAAAASTDKYAFVTPADKYVHWRPADIDIPKGEMVFSVFECNTSTVNAGWTPVTSIFNHNRTNTSTATALIYSAATSTVNTAEIDRFAIYGGSGPGKTKHGASDGKDIEWVFARNTQYRFEVDTTEAYHIRLFWYEEDDG